MSMQTLTWDVDAAVAAVAAVAGNSDAYHGLALATQARQKWFDICQSCG